MAEENLGYSQQKQKWAYDTQTKDKLKQGDWVLVLIPDNNQKLLLWWQGPFQLTTKLGLVNYEVQRMNQIRKRQNDHISMLEKWKSREAWHMKGKGEVGDSDDIGDLIVSKLMAEEP